ncbi:MAG: GTPase Era [Succinivibrio sp.]|nr:GTPase Era [Succinivibrio sp.]
MDHFGFVALIGRPNVGKSTLMNHLIGQKISITSRKPQTTRNRVMGIETDGEYQIVYVDTPGLHREEKHAINKLMNKAAESALGDVEMILLLIDPQHWTDDDEMVFAKIKNVNIPVVLVINKIDQVSDKESLLPLIDRLSQSLKFKEIIPISALKGNNLGELRKIIRSVIPEGQHMFPDDTLTDRSSRFLAAEIVREKLMRQMGDELPYSSTVEIDEFKEEPEILRISATILVERAGQKKMVVGAGGQRIKKIGTEARMDMEKLFESKVFLRLFVKVKAGWSDDERALKSLGYDDFQL